MSNGAMLPREFPGLGRLLDRVFACRKHIYSLVLTSKTGRVYGGLGWKKDWRKVAFHYAKILTLFTLFIVFTLFSLPCVLSLFFLILPGLFRDSKYIRHSYSPVVVPVYEGY
jgi:hypothetical protein